MVQKGYIESEVGQYDPTFNAPALAAVVFSSNYCKVRKWMIAEQNTTIDT